jgi:hypothetical protein
MNSLRASQGVPVKKEEQSCFAFSPEQGKGIDQYERREPGDAEQYSKDLYFRDIMHVILGAVPDDRPQIYRNRIIP